MFRPKVIRYRKIPLFAVHLLLISIGLGNKSPIKMGRSRKIGGGEYKLSADRPRKSILKPLF